MSVGLKIQSKWHSGGEGCRAVGVTLAFGESQSKKASWARAVWHMDPLHSRSHEGSLWYCVWEELLLFTLSVNKVHSVSSGPGTISNPRNAVRVCVNGVNSLLQGTSLVVQWLSLCAPSAGGLGSISGKGTKILCATTEIEDPLCNN